MYIKAATGFGTIWFAQSVTHLAAQFGIREQNWGRPHFGTLKLAKQISAKGSIAGFSFQLKIF